MRLHVLALAALVTAFAGCSGSDPEAEPMDNAAPAMPVNATLPAEIRASEDVTGSLDPLNLAMEPICASPTAQCFEYPFTVEGNASVVLDGTLTWNYPANDFDLYVYEGETEALTGGASDITSGPGTMEHIAGPVGPGDYEIIVVAWGVAQDTFDLVVTFAAT